MFGNSGVEIAGYNVIDSDGAFEVREYKELVLVETSVEGSYEDMDGVAFNRLFKYISGANVTEQNIAMTAPVIMQEKSGQEIAMTAPVLMNENQEASSWTMAFVLPSEFTLETAPQPASEDVSLRKVENYKVASVQFSGRLNQDLINQKTVELQSWIALKNLKATGAPQVAGYNPPWTLPQMRRNEILIPIE